MTQATKGALSAAALLANPQVLHEDTVIVTVGQADIAILNMNLIYD